MLLAGPLLLPSEAHTAMLAGRLAPRLGAGDTLLLSGPVGAGKSAFARALIRARLRDPAAEVPSPSFTLVQTYGEQAGEALWHADLYRLSGPEEVLELGLAAAMEGAICLIEWPDRLGSLVPASALRLELAPLSEASGQAADDATGDAARTATFSGPPAWAPRLSDLLAALHG